jgi:hypothetical protein
LFFLLLLLALSSFAHFDSRGKCAGGAKKELYAKKIINALKPRFYLS